MPHTSKGDGPAPAEVITAFLLHWAQTGASGAFTPLSAISSEVQSVAMAS